MFFLCFIIILNLYICLVLVKLFLTAVVLAQDELWLDGSQGVAALRSRPSAWLWQYTFDCHAGVDVFQTPEPSVRPGCCGTE